MVRDKVYYDALAEVIVGSAYKVGGTLGCGFLEKVYENSLAIELVASGLNVETQKPIKVRYEGEVVGEYFADMLVENDIVVELTTNVIAHGVQRNLKPMESVRRWW